MHFLEDVHRTLRFLNLDYLQPPCSPWLPAFQCSGQGQGLGLPFEQSRVGNFIHHEHSIGWTIKQRKVRQEGRDDDIAHRVHSVCHSPFQFGQLALG